MPNDHADVTDSEPCPTLVLEKAAAHIAEVLIVEFAA